MEAVLRATHGRGVDLAVEASGSPAGIAAGIKALRPGGRMAVLGATKQPSVPIPWDAALRKAVTLQFNMMSDYTHMDRALALLAAFPGIFLRSSPIAIPWRNGSSALPSCGTSRASRDLSPSVEFCCSYAHLE